MNMLMIVAVIGLIASVLGYALRRMGELKGTRFFANAANPPNPGTWSLGLKTYKADAAIAAFLLVKQGSDVDHIAVSAAETDVIIGVTDDSAAAAEDDICVKLFGAAPGTFKVTANAVIALNAKVASAGNGKVHTADTGDFCIGRALQAAGADGDIIAIQPVLSTLAEA